MKIASFCQREFVTIHSHELLRNAAALMREQHVGALVVIDSAEPPHVLGVVTDRDLAIEVLARDLNVAATRIGEIASNSLVAVAATASVHEAVSAMKESGVRRLLVTEEDGSVIGFVSADDLIAAIASELGSLASALRNVITRENAERAALSTPLSRPVLLPRGVPGAH
ncbi:MAG: CBS domain-containing protein [Ramlibacter sp.]|nr:CBS domain-containing protein [Ramlibacter sp.]